MAIYFWISGYLLIGYAKIIHNIAWENFVNVESSKKGQFYTWFFPNIRRNGVLDLARTRIFAGIDSRKVRRC